MELASLAPQPIEIVYSVAAVVALVFAVYAIRQMIRREWTTGFGLTLVLLTFVVPFAGPVIVGALRVSSVAHSRRRATEAGS